MLSSGSLFSMNRWLVRIVWLTVLVGAPCFLPGSVLAQKGAQNAAALIAKGQNFFDEQRYDESTQTLSAALLRPDTSTLQKTTIFKLLAFNYILLNKKDEAEGAVRGLLVTDESFVLPTGESPRFREFFEETRTRWSAEGKPGLKDVSTEKQATNIKIRHTSPAQMSSSSAIALSGEVDDPAGAVTQLRLLFRQGSSDKFIATKVKYAMRKFTMEIPAASVRPPLVEYYIEALDENGLPIATRGDAESPLRIAVPASAGVFASPWFWVPVGVVVVAAIVIPIVILSTRTTTADVLVTVTE